MGNSCSANAANRRSQRISATLARSRFEQPRVSILLLGPAESGKSTFMKQIKIIYGPGHFDRDEEQLYRTFIYQNVVHGMGALVDGRERLEQLQGAEFRWRNAESSSSATRMQLLCADADRVKSLRAATFADIVPDVMVLWRDDAIRITFDWRSLFAAPPPDTLQFFLDHVQRLAQPDYVPTNRDIIFCRRPTHAISEYRIDIENIPFRFIDVGGQRTQRQKWFQVFYESITAILFFVALSEYDQVCSEDTSKNRLDEACDVYAAIVNNPFCAPLILFMNKKDRLEEKLATSSGSIARHFPDFNGDPKSAPEVQNYILGKVMNRRLRKEKVQFHHFTNATDSDNIRKVFNACRQIIRSTFMADMGFI